MNSVAMPDNSKVRKISFSSHIRKEYRDAVESLLFFNEQQDRFSDSIMRSIDTYCTPEIVTEGELLRIRINGAYDAQTICAFDEESFENSLIGIIIYTRSSAENIVVLHIAVDQQYAIDGIYADEMLTLRLIMKVKEAGRLLKGVTSIRIAYADNLDHPFTLPVR